MKNKTQAVFSILSSLFIPLSAQNLDDEIQRFSDNVQAIEDVVNGPATGPGSVVTLPLGGTQDTIAKAIDSIPALSGKLDFDATQILNQTQLDQLDENWPGAKNQRQFINVLDHGAIPDDATDDTAAIQAAIDAAETAGGGTILFPYGKYLVEGALQEPGGGNAQLLLPTRNTATDSAVSIRFLGEGPFYNQWPITDTFTPPTLGVIIESTLDGPVGNMIGCTSPSSTYGGPDVGAWPVSRVNFEAKDITFAIPENPTITAINLGWVHYATFDNVMIRNENFNLKAGGGEPVEPTTATSYGLIAPYKDSNGMRFTYTTIAGLYNGLQISEHVMFDELRIMNCKVAMELQGGTYSSGGTTFLAHECATTFKWTGSGFSGSDPVGTGIPNLAINIDRCVVEDHTDSGGGQWYDVVYNIDDPNDYGRGLINYVSYESGTGVAGGRRLSRWRHNGGYTGLECKDMRVPIPTYRVHNNANQTIANSTTTRVQFNTVDYNSLVSGGWSNEVWFENVTEGIRTRFDAPGLYEVTARVRWDANTTGTRQLTIVFDPSSSGTDRVLANNRVVASSDGPTLQTVRAVVPIESMADSFQIQATQTSGGNLDLTFVDAQQLYTQHLEVRKVGSYQRRGY